MICVRRTTVLLFSGILMMLLACATQYQPGAQGRIVANEMANIKAQPSFSAANIATVTPGAVLLLVERRESWYKVKLPNAQYGWIHESLVHPENYKVVRINKEVEMRHRPDRFSAVMRILPRGTQIRELERVDEWVKIQASEGGAIGWAPRGKLNSATLVDSHIADETFVESGVQLYAKSGANIRRGPGRQYESVATVNGSDRLSWKATSGDWFQVQLSDGRDGYIWREVVSNPLPDKISSTRSADIMSAPSEASRIQRTVDAYTPLKVMDSRNDWYLVEFRNGSLGWLRSTNTTKPQYGPYSPSETYDTEPSTASFGMYYALKDATIYSSQSGGGSRVRQVNAGERLMITKFESDMCKVITNDGGTGYISRNDFAGAKYKYLMTSRALNVREGPGRDYRTIERRDIGMDAILLDVNNDWCNVYFPEGGTTGWIWGPLLLPSKYRVIYVTRDNSIVRDNNSQESSRVDEYDSGVEITFVEKIGDWYKFNPLMKNVNPATWIHAQVTSVPRYGYGIPIRDDVIRMSAYDREPGRYTATKMCAELPLIELQGDWYKVEIPGTPKIGYIRKSSVEQCPYGPLVVIRSTRLRPEPGCGRGQDLGVEPGAEVTLLRQRRGQYYVKLIQAEGSYYGWISQSDAVEPDLGSITINESQYLLYGPANDYATRSKTHRQQKAKILDQDGEWVQIRIGNETGWINGSNTWAGRPSYPTP